MEQLLAKRHAQGDSATAAALRSFRNRSLNDIEGWTAQLAEGKVTPERALDWLREARTRLSSLLERHADTVFEGFAKNGREADVMHRNLNAGDGGTALHEVRDNLG